MTRAQWRFVASEMEKSPFVWWRIHLRNGLSIEACEFTEHMVSDEHSVLCVEAEEDDGGTTRSYIALDDISAVDVVLSDP